MGNFLESLKQSSALKWLLVWGLVIVGAVLAIHFFSKKQTATSAAAGDTTGTGTPSVSNTTVLINGYPPQAGTTTTPPPGGGTVGVKMPTGPFRGQPVGMRPITAPPPSSGVKMPTGPFRGQPIVKGPIVGPPPGAFKGQPIIRTPIIPPVAATQAITMSSPAQVKANMAVSASRVAAADAKVNPTVPVGRRVSQPSYHHAPIVVAVRHAASSVTRRVATVNARLARAGV